jgi:hypothetical protein
METTVILMSGWGIRTIKGVVLFVQVGVHFFEQEDLIRRRD